MQTPEKYAQSSAGNWQYNVQVAYWYDEDHELDDSWAVFQLPNKYDNLLDKANNITIKKLLPESDCVRYWATRSIDYVCIKVYTGDIDTFMGIEVPVTTDAFDKWYDIQDRLESYCSLNDDLWSELESEETWENLTEGLKLADIENNDLLLADDRVLPAVYHWLSNYAEDELQPMDGFGGYPSEESIIEALLALKLIDYTPDDSDDIYEYIAVQNPVLVCGCHRLTDQHTCTQFCGHSYGCNCWGE